MTKARLKAFRKILEVRKTELARELYNRGAIIFETRSDVMDQLQGATECDLAISILSLRRAFASGVEAALQRMHEGTFGVCLYCGQEIGSKRLEAIPWTPLCIRCQEAADRDERDVVESVQPLQVSPPQRYRDRDSNRSNQAA